MKSNKHSKLLLIIIFAIVIILSGLTAVFCILFAKGWDPPDAIAHANYSTKKLLEFASKYPTGELPQKDIPSYLWVNEECWELLQQTIKENGNAYYVTAYKNGPEFRDIDDITSQTDFANGQRILIGYYEGGVTWCQESTTR